MANFLKIFWIIHFESSNVSGTVFIQLYLYHVQIFHDTIFGSPVNAFGQYTFGTVPDLVSACDALNLEYRNNVGEMIEFIGCEASVTYSEIAGQIDDITVQTMWQHVSTYFTHKKTLLSKYKYRTRLSNQTCQTIILKNVWPYYLYPFFFKKNLLKKI